MRIPSRVICLLFSCQLFAITVWAVNGATVQAITLKPKSAAVAIFNQSTDALTNFAMSITETSQDGSVRYSRHMEDLGPFQKDAWIAPGQTKEYEIPLGGPTVKFEATIVAAIYADGTAEANVDGEGILQDAIRARRAAAQALRQSSDILTAALPQPHPSVYAHKLLKQLLAELKERQYGHEEEVDTGYIKDVVNLMQHSPQDVTEGSFVKEQASRLQEEAAVFSTYAQVRRLP